VATDSDRPDPAEPELDDLVGEWLTVPDIAERLGVPLAAVRTMLQEREVLGVRRGERRVVSIPARFFTESGPLPELPGTFTVLADGGMRDEEILRWLFTTDPTLPDGGAPIDALRAGFKTEIRRRAMETAF
jgi:hypothetical protein